jgi:hypothetical protein
MNKQSLGVLVSGALSSTDRAEKNEAIAMTGISITNAALRSTAGVNLSSLIMPSAKRAK